MPIVITAEAKAKTAALLELFIREMKIYLERNPSVVNFPPGRSPCRNGHLRIKRATRTAAPGLSILVQECNVWRTIVRVDTAQAKSVLTIMWPAARHVLEALCREETRVKLALCDITNKKRDRFLTVCKSGEAEIVALAAALTGALCATGGFRQ